MRGTQGGLRCHFSPAKEKQENGGEITGKIEKGEEGIRSMPEEKENQR